MTPIDILFAGIEALMEYLSVHVLTLEHTGCPVTVHVVVTDLGIRKTSNLHLDYKDMAKVENAVKEKLK